MTGFSKDFTGSSDGPVSSDSSSDCWNNSSIGSCDSSCDGLTSSSNGSGSVGVSFEGLTLSSDGLLEGFSDLKCLWGEVTTVDCWEVSSCFTFEVMLGSVTVLERLNFSRGLYPWKGCTWATNDPLLRGRILLGIVFILFFLLLAMGIEVDLV